MSCHLIIIVNIFKYIIADTLGLAGSRDRIEADAGGFRGRYEARRWTIGRSSRRGGREEGTVHAQIVRTVSRRAGAVRRRIRGTGRRSGIGPAGGTGPRIRRRSAALARGVDSGGRTDST